MIMLVYIMEHCLVSTLDMTESSETSCNEAKTYLIIGPVTSVIGTIAGIAGLLFAARSWGCFNTLTVPSSSKKPDNAKSGVNTEDNPAYSVSLSLQYQGTVDITSPTVYEDSAYEVIPL